MSAPEPDSDVLRQQLLEGWESAAPAWGRLADRVRDWGMPVSEWMIEQLQLQPGERLLELAAGPGDTGFLAAEQIRPGGTLISSDAADAMLEVARQRARAFGIDNVEFSRLELEWIDLDTASVDAVLCRWGYMLSVDPETGLRETRRVLRPGGRLALAVWDAGEHNPWATIPGRALVNRGLPAPDPAGPGMFALAAPGRLQELLESAGFVETLVTSVLLAREYPDVAAYVGETQELSRLFSAGYEQLSEADQARVRSEIEAEAAPFTAADGSLRLPGRSLVAVANA